MSQHRGTMTDTNPDDTMPEDTKEDTPQNAAELQVSEKFLLEEKDGERWVARLIWAPRGQPTGLWVRLYEPARGKIMIDYGSRASGGRKTTGKSDRQEAIWHAEEKLKKLVIKDTREDEDGRDLYDELADADGDPSLWDVFSLYLKDKPASNTPGTGISPKWHGLVARVRDTCAYMFGRDFAALDATKQVADEYIERRTSEDIDFGGGRRRLYARDCEKGTAAKEVRIIFTVLKHASKKILHGERRPALRYNPMNAKELPAKSEGKGKRPITLDMYAALMDPVENEDGTFGPAPMDQVDPVGRARIVYALQYHHGGRKGAYTRHRSVRDRVPGMRRKDLARTQEEVRELFRRMEDFGAFGVTVEMAEYFAHGVVAYWWENDKEGCRADQSPQEWWRFYPLTEDMAAEWDLYHKRTEEHYGRKEDGGLGGAYDWHPDAPLFRDYDDSTQPLRDSTMWRATQYKKAKGGEPNYTRTGAEVEAKARDVLRDEMGEPLIRSQGGWFRQAQYIARTIARERGEDPDKVMPIYHGEQSHGARGAWIKRVEECGWLVQVKDHDDQPIDLNRHVLYLEGRKVPPTPRVRNYMKLWPEILMGIAEYRNRAEVMAERERLASEDAREKVAASARKRELAYGGKPNLKVVNGDA